MSKKLMSVAVKFYNQREYVEPCLKSVLGQTYSPLEIVVVDDKSTDGSYELAKEIADEYIRSGGGHKIVVCQNEVNMERSRTLERAIDLCHGELIFQADGDDISLPDRVEKVVAKWKEDGCRASVIWSGCYYIDGRDNIIGERGGACGDKDFPIPFGAVNAYKRSSLLGFPKVVIDRMSHDDVLFVNRTRMNPGAKYLDITDRLVFYRMGGISNIGGGDLIRGRLANVERTQNTLRFLLDELDTVGIGRGMSVESVENLRMYWAKRWKGTEISLKKYAGKTWKARWHGFSAQHSSWRGAWFWLVDLPLLGPSWFSRFTTFIYSRSIVGVKRMRQGKRRTVQDVLKAYENK